MNNSSRDKVKAHLDKSIISNVIQTARATLKEPSRPFTPGETLRTLFNNTDLSRPGSSYSIKSLNKELEPLKNRPTMLETPIQTGRKVMTENSKSSKRVPIKVSTEIQEECYEENYVLGDMKNIIFQLELFKQNLEQEIDEDSMEDLLENFTSTLAEIKYLENKPSWATCEEFLKQLALTTTYFEKHPSITLKIAKCLLENITNHDLLFKKNSSDLVPSTLALSSIKVLYQLSKNKENDKIFVKEDFLDTIYSLLLNIMAEDTYTDIDLPYEFLLFLLGTLKNLTSNIEISETSSKFISPISGLLPSPLQDTVPNTSKKHMNLLVQVTGILKNVFLLSSLEFLLQFQILESLLFCIKIYNDQEILINSLKAISKLSLEDIVCVTLRNFLEILFSVVQIFS